MSYEMGIIGLGQVKGRTAGGTGKAPVLAEQR